jgi:hypothetical protein
MPYQKLALTVILLAQEKGMGGRMGGRDREKKQVSLVFRL